MQINSPDTGTATSTYDLAGDLSAMTDGRGATALYSYDGLNRVTQVQYERGGSTDQTTSFGYGTGAYGKGRLTSAGDGNQALAWTYDALGRVVSKQQTIGAITESVGYSYSNGNLTSETTPSGQLITYSYNNNHQVVGISVIGTTLISGVTYEPFGAVNNWTWGNGTSSSRTYSGDGLVTQIVSAGASTYTYNPDSTINSRTDSATNGYSVVSGTTTMSVSSNGNQITSTSGALVRTFGYDGTGNVAADGASQFAFDDANRLVAVSQGSTSTSFLVNALGERIRKSSGAVTTLFGYDEAGQLIGEYTAYLTSSRRHPSTCRRCGASVKLDRAATLKLLFAPFALSIFLSFVPPLLPIEHSRTGAMLLLLGSIVATSSWIWIG